LPALFRVPATRNGNDTAQPIAVDCRAGTTGRHGRRPAPRSALALIGVFPFRDDLIGVWVDYFGGHGTVRV
jgi:hypothetical protein